MQTEPCHEFCQQIHNDNVQKPKYMESSRIESFPLEANILFLTICNVRKVLKFE